MIGGVVQWAIGTSRSVRTATRGRRRSPTSVVSPSSSARLAPATAAASGAPTVAPFREQDTRFLEQLPDRRHGERRVGRRDVTGQAGVRIRLVDPTAREDEHVAGERHRRGALRQEDLRAGRARPQQDDRRRGQRRSELVWVDRPVGHAGPS